MMPKKISGISMVRKSAISGMFSLLMVKALTSGKFRGEMRTLGSGVGNNRHLYRFVITAT